MFMCQFVRYVILMLRSTDEDMDMRTFFEFNIVKDLNLTENEISIA